jgi:hypothetical protein
MDLTLLSGGPARVYVDVASTLTEVGHLFGGVDVNIPEPAVMDLMADELGQTPADGVYNGMSARPSVVIRMAEFSLTNLQRAIPNSTLITDGTTPTKKRLEVRSVSGTKLSAGATKWVVKPIDPSTGAVSTDANTWVTVHKGVAIGAVNTSYKNGEQRVIELTLTALPDGTSNNRTISYGDITATA